MCHYLIHGVAGWKMPPRRTLLTGAMGFVIFFPFDNVDAHDNPAALFAGADNVVIERLPAIVFVVQSETFRIFAVPRAAMFTIPCVTADTSWAPYVAVYDRRVFRPEDFFAIVAIRAIVVVA